MACFEVSLTQSQPANIMTMKKKIKLTLKHDVQNYPYLMLISSELLWCFEGTCSFMSTGIGDKTN